MHRGRILLWTSSSSLRYVDLYLQSACQHVFSTYTHTHKEGQERGERREKERHREGTSLLTRPQIRKRIFQTTGVLVPDARLGAARTIKHILTLAIKKPTPPKLATLLEERGVFQELPNFKLHSRKLGPVDREIAVGRWKVIEEELQKRNLPVTGTAGLPPNKERQRMEGKIA